jgi:hypothetical protein
METDIFLPVYCGCRGSIAPPTPPPIFAAQSRDARRAGRLPSRPLRIVLAYLVVAVGLLGQTLDVSAFMVIGAGVPSCGTWTVDRRYPSGPAALQDEEWVLG